MGEWPEAVERVAVFLHEARAEARIEEFPDGTTTARDAARAVGCEPAQIVKSLIFLCDGLPVLVLVPGNRRADPAKVAMAVGAAKASVATAEDVQRATGFEPGAVAPFPLARTRPRVLIDHSLLGGGLVWVGAGSAHHVAGIQLAELVRLTRASPMDVVQDRA